MIPKTVFIKMSAAVCDLCSWENWGLVCVCGSGSVLKQLNQKQMQDRQLSALPVLHILCQAAAGQAPHTRTIELISVKTTAQGGSCFT